MVDLAEPTGIRRVATAHWDPEKVQLAEEWLRKYPIDPHEQTGVPHVIRTGEPEYVP